MADNNIIIKITSETDLNSAQQQMKELTERAQAQEQAMRDLSDIEKQDAASIKKLGLSEKELANALKKNSDYYRSLKDAKKAEVAETKRSIKELQKQVNAYKTLNGQSGRMVTQLRAMREQLMRMEEAGEFGTKAFMELSIAAGKLEDQIGDTQQRIRILSSDTIGLDTAMGISDGLAGSFYVATSAAELFGGEMEGLQQAFYKVQAAMSIMSGVQQIANTLNKDSVVSVVAQTAATKLKEKAELKNAAATTASNAATGTQTIVTKIATKAQIGLNTAIAANPLAWLIGIIVAAVAAFAALGIGIYKLVQNFTAAGKAQKDYAKAAKELEEIQAKNAIGAEKRAYEHQRRLQQIDNAEQEALSKAKDRNASTIEMAQLQSKYAKKKVEEAKRNSNEEIPLINKEIKKLGEMVNAKQREVNAYGEGTKKKKKAQEELNEVTQQYYEILQRGRDLEQEYIDSQRESADAARALNEARAELRLQAQQANIDLMKEGATKEIAQIKLNYKEQLKAIQGGSKEEKALRKALLEKQELEIAAVRRKYALQAQQTEIQEQKNLLSLMSRSMGTESDYEEQISLTKEIAQAEAQARIDALDQSTMSEREYAAQKVAIEEELASTLADIDNREIERLNANAQRRTAIAIQEAEARKNALTGAESTNEQKAVVDEYYYYLRTQMEQNAQIEIEAVKRSTDTEEVKAERIKEINAKLQADILENTKSAAQERINIDTQYLGELERQVTITEDAVSHAQTASGKIGALRDNLDAQKELYAAQMESIKSQYDAGLITFQDFKQQEFDIVKATADAEAEYQASKMEAITEGFSTALGYMQQVSDLAFEALGNNVQAELDALDEMYTTDAQEAKENANKKYISEKEYEKKKAALEMKQAKYAKAQALINAGINTAMAIVTTLAQLGATPWGIAASVIAASMGAAQIGIIASKPLAQYEKGRNGGKGEYALVGERGPEIMYVPHGASIVPNNKIDNPATWGEYGVPTLAIPATPNVDTEVMKVAMSQQPIDYDRLGKAVAANMPKQQAVHVNVDRTGVTVQSGHDTRTYLNTKYYGQWR